MVIPNRQRTESRGSLVTELVIALGILAAVMLPLSFGFLQDAKLARAAYRQAVAMEIVDGEMEVLMAGEWRAFPAGTHAYPVRAASATNLPPGRFTLTVTPEAIRLEWRPAGRGGGSPIARQAALPPAKNGGGQ